MKKITLFLFINILFISVLPSQTTDLVFNVATVEDIRNHSAGFQREDAILTQGYYAPNDGGSAHYVVEYNGDEVDNGGDIIRISDTLIARMVRGNIINVRQFGAVGLHGHEDDTQAIQNALAYSRKRELGTFSSTSLPNSLPVSVYFGANLKVLFPCGKYQISSTIQIDSYVDIIGENATIFPSPALKASGAPGFSGSGWLGTFENIQFIHFGIAIQINTNNVNTGVTKIMECTFIDNDLAIELNAKSSITKILQCRFHENTKVLDLLYGDKVVFEEAWITSSKMSGHQPCQIENWGGVLHFNKNLLVPRLSQTGCTEPAWINNHNTVYIDQTRQGGESGAFTLVNNFAAADITYPVWPNCVSVTNSDCYGGHTANSTTDPNTRITVLRLIKIPNVIKLNNLRGMVDTSLMGFSEDVTDVDALIETQDLANPDRLHPICKISYQLIMGTGGYVEPYVPTVPDELQQFIECCSSGSSSQ